MCLGALTGDLYGLVLSSLVPSRCRDSRGLAVLPGLLPMGTFVGNVPPGMEFGGSLGTLTSCILELRQKIFHFLHPFGFAFQGLHLGMPGEDIVPKPCTVSPVPDT